MTSLSSILSDRNVKTETLDALTVAYLPLLKDATQHDLMNVIFLLKRAITFKAMGDDESAERVFATADLIRENVAVEAKYTLQEFLNDKLPEIVVGLASKVTA